MTTDPGVRDMLSFLIARDTMHQKQWLAAIQDLETEGFDETPVPATFPQELEKGDVAYQFIDASEGSESREGRWANGPSIDGRGFFSYAKIKPLTDDEGLLGQVDPRTYGTPAQPFPAQAAE
jgi:Mn-containing catalase